MRVVGATVLEAKRDLGIWENVAQNLGSIGGYILGLIVGEEVIKDRLLQEIKGYIDEQEKSEKVKVGNTTYFKKGDKYYESVNLDLDKIKNYSARELTAIASMIRASTGLTQEEIERERRKENARKLNKEIFKEAIPLLLNKAKTIDDVATVLYIFNSLSDEVSDEEGLLIKQKVLEVLKTPQAQTQTQSKSVKQQPKPKQQPKQQQDIEKFLKGEYDPKEYMSLIEEPEKEEEKKIEEKEKKKYDPVELRFRK